MNGVPRPLIGGVAGGVGTSVLASALYGTDVGVASPGQQLHILVCRSATASLRRAEGLLAVMQAPPVLAVVADIPHANYPAGALSCTRRVDSLVTAQIRFPFVAVWRDVDDVAGRASELLSERPRRRSEAEYARALRMTITAVTALLTPAPGPGRRPGPGEPMPLADAARPSVPSQPQPSATSQPSPAVAY